MDFLLHSSRPEMPNRLGGGGVVLRNQSVLSQTGSLEWVERCVLSYAPLLL